MPLPFVFVRAAVIALAIGLSGRDGSPRVVVAHALRAVEGDSAAAVVNRWQRSLAAGNDRSAALGLATIARLTYRYDDADQRFEALLRGTSARIRPDAPGTPARRPDLVTVYAALGYAWSLDARGLSARADSAFVRARFLARVMESEPAASEALIGLSLNRASRRGAAVGLALLDTAARLAPTTAGDLRADIAVRRAVLAAARLRPDAATQALEAAAAARQAGEPRLEALALRALALDLELTGRLDSAGVVLMRVEAIERRVGDRARLAETLMRHADVFHDRGDIGPFKQYALAAQVEARRSHNLYALAASNVGLGSVSLLLNDLVSAGIYLGRAAAQYDTMQDESGFALVRMYRADLAADAGQWSVARDLAVEARNFDHGIGDLAAEFEEWRDLVAIDIRATDLTGAERSLAGAEALTHGQGQRRWDASLDIDRGRLALAEGRPAAAAAALGRYLAILDTTEHVMRYSARALLAEAEAREGSLDRAELELTAAEDELDAWRATLTDRELRPFIFQIGATEVNDRDAATATVLAAVATAQPRMAFALAERRRARDLADDLVRLAALRDEAVDTSSRTTAKPPGSLTRNGDVAARAAGEQGAADSVAAVLGGRETAFLEFVTGAYGAPTTLFVIRQAPTGSPETPSTATIRSYTLPSADSLAGSIERLVALVEDGGDPVALARTVGARTLGAALRDLGPDVTRLIIAPDGPLYRTPFDVLRTVDDVPVGARYAVTLVPSGSVLHALRRRARPAGTEQRPPTLLALADPALPEAIPQHGSGADDEADEALDSTAVLDRLGGSADEARRVARYASAADIRLGAAASGAYLLHARLDDYRVIHLATHALVDERSVARTALVLAPGGEEGLVTPAQLASLRLNADLVVLSACRTAGGVVVAGDGVQGLTGPLLAAGARSVVATQWRVGDRAMAPLLDAFYRAMARGLPVGDALEVAKRSAISLGAAPEVWAAFTVVGDPLARPPLRLPGAGWPVAIAWVAGGLAVMAVMGFRGRASGVRNDARSQ